MVSRALDGQAAEVLKGFPAGIRTEESEGRHRGQKWLREVDAPSQQRLGHFVRLLEGF